jgi:hypothetical protein
MNKRYCNTLFILLKFVIFYFQVYNMKLTSHYFIIYMFKCSNLALNNTTVLIIHRDNSKRARGEGRFLHSHTSVSLVLPLLFVEDNS